jgi:pyruvate/2-oxoglutarate dehydrogenase complex dihydrolipoamide acyltransferase (E2) component
MAAPAVEDSFSVGNSVAVTETDKASMNFEAQDDGVVAKLLVSTVTTNVSISAAIMATVEDAPDAGADSTTAQRNMSGRSKGFSNANKQKMELKWKRATN